MYALPLLRPGRCMSRVERSLHTPGSRNLRPIRLRRYLITALLVLPLLAKFPLQTAAQAQDAVGTSLLATPDAQAQDAVVPSLLSIPDAAADTVVTVTLSIPDAEADEADVSNTAEIVVTLDSPLESNESLGIPLNFSGGTPGIDFTLQKDVSGVRLEGQRLIFYDTSDVQKVTIVLTPILDNDDTNDVVTVSIPTSVYTGGLSPDPNLQRRGEAKGVRIGNGEITLLDAARPLASFAAVATSAGEGAGTRNVRVNLSSAPTSAITLAYAVGGTATAGTDYARLSGSIQVSANANSVNIPVSITDDSAIESNETVTLTLTSATSYRLGSPSKHTLTIEDNDTPSASFAAATSSAAEDAGTHNVRVNLSPAPTSATTLRYTVGGTATAGGDYARLSGSVQASANANSVNIPVSITDDALVEADETVVLTLTSGTGYELGSRTRHTLTITNDDSGGSTPEASFSSSSSSGAEGGGTQNLQVNLSPAPQSSITITYTVGGTATEGSDYATLSGSVQASANATRVNIPVSITDDDLVESSETVVLTLTSGTGYELGSTTRHTLTITDNDSGGSTPQASFEFLGSSAREGAGAVNAQVNLSPAPQSAITITYTVGGTATSGSDYATLPGSVQASANATSVIIPVLITDDALEESSETVVLTLTSGTGYELGSTTKYTLTITDNDSGGGSTPSVRFSSSSSSAAEDVGTQNVQVNLSPAPQSSITIAYTVGGTASSGADYTRLPGSVQAGANATSVIIPVSITDDALVEGDETVVLTLASGTGYTVRSPAAHSLTIRDNDNDNDSGGGGGGGGTPSVRFSSSSSSGAEDVGTQNVQVNLSPAPQSSITIAYTVGGTASSGADYTRLPGSVQAGANATSVIIPVSITDDALVEGDETVVLTLAPGTGYTRDSPSAHTLTITDNDNDNDSGGGGGGGGGTPSVRFSSSSSSGAEDMGTQNVQVNLSPAPQSSITIAYTVGGTASSGADYASLPGSVQAGANATSVIIPVSITDDALVEGAETVMLTLASGTGYTVGSPSAHTLTITDNDNDSGGGGGGVGGGGAPSVSFETTLSGAAEDAGTQNVQVNLSPAPQSSITIAYTVGGTASSGADKDYTPLSGSVSAAANATSVNIPLTLADDMLDENDETVVLTLTSGVGYAVGLSNVHTFVIQDDDAGPAARFAAASSGASEGAGAQSVTVSLFPVPQSDVTLSYTVTGTASSGEDYASLSGSVQVLAQATSVDIPLEIMDDALAEGDETVVLRLNSGTGYTAGLPDEHLFVIRGDDGAPAVIITGGPPVTEGESAWFKVTTTPAASNLEVTVMATEIGDFGVGSWTTSILSHWIEFSVTTIDDNISETDGLIRMTLDIGAGYTLGSPSSAAVIVMDNDAPPLSAEPADTEIPAAFALEQNYPNPFNPSTTIGFSLARSQRVRLLVYDMLGQEVRVLLDGVQPAGRHRVAFDASGLASGAYLYVLRTEEQAAVKTMALLK